MRKPRPPEWRRGFLASGISRGCLYVRGLSGLAVVACWALAADPSGAVGVVPKMELGIEWLVAGDAADILASHDAAQYAGSFGLMLGPVAAVRAATSRLVPVFAAFVAESSIGSGVDGVRASGCAADALAHQPSHSPPWRFPRLSRVRASGLVTLCAVVLGAESRSRGSVGDGPLAVEADRHRFVVGIVLSGVDQYATSSTEGAAWRHRRIVRLSARLTLAPRVPLCAEPALVPPLAITVPMGAITEDIPHGKTDWQLNYFERHQTSLVLDTPTSKPTCSSSVSRLVQ
ncbi:hypothetical protein ATK74_1766 [Propionicimonas paludicola]|uniref:Uncharacterized protein n=1 Tax=Propionicimonas paludicola TaxID=185243 RepID=A0A2A9CRZ8_9ACTN|nr:hypothetical protein ATK74_1766 [Propionicimonas paludicola]